MIAGRHVKIPSLVLLVTAGLARAGQDQMSITEFGAIGDGRTLNTTSIQRAIDSMAVKGGGTILVPPGVFLSGTLQLRTNTNLHLAEGAVLRGSANVQDYVLGGRLVGLLFTQDATNASITGQGTIDGNGDAFMDLTHAKHIENAGVQWTRQRERFREVLTGIGDGPAVPKDRPYQMIIFSDCRRVTVRDVFITNSPFWTVHFADCDGVLITGVRIWCNLLVPNNDGVDFTSSSNVIMSDCDIRTGDDCVAITGYSHHFDLPGYKNLKHPLENVTISNCLMQSRSAAIRIGGFDQNTMRNITISNVTITNSNRGIGLFVRDQGSIENVFVSNLIVDTRLHTGDWWGNGEPIHLSAVRLTKDVPLGKIRNISFQNVICKSESGILIYGSSESVIENVSMENVTLHIADSPLNETGGGNYDLRPVLDEKLQLFAHDIAGLHAQYVKNLRIRDFRLSWDSVKAPFFTHGLDIAQFDGVAVDGFSGSAAPFNPKASPIILRDGRGADLRAGKLIVVKERVRQ
jgi:polygalacturonase